MQTGMINTAATTATTSGTAATTPSNTIDKNGFLQLLVAQLKNQDPTSSSSQDPSAMVQQMTSFSTLEQAQQTNTLLQGLQSSMTGLSQSQAAALIGKTVQVSGSQFNLSSGSASMKLNLGAPANVTLTVKNASGQAVCLLPQGHLNAGSNTLTWNGKDANGNQLPDGTYQVSVSAMGANGAQTTYTSSMGVKVSGVSVQNGAVNLSAGSSTYALTDVLAINA
jgi:flagellar basal-body rod modification protein FlgD